MHIYEYFQTLNNVHYSSFVHLDVRRLEPSINSELFLQINFLKGRFQDTIAIRRKMSKIILILDHFQSLKKEKKEYLFSKTRFIILCPLKKLTILFCINNIKVWDY